MIAKDEGEGLFRPEALPADTLIPRNQQCVAGPERDGRLCDDVIVAFFQKRFEGRRDCHAGVRIRLALGLAVLVLHDFRDAVTVGINMVPGEFPLDPDPDDERNGHPGGEADNIDKGIDAILAQLPEGEEEIVFEHALSLRILKTSSENSTHFSTS